MGLNWSPVLPGDPRKAARVQDRASPWATTQGPQAGSSTQFALWVWLGATWSQHVFPVWFFQQEQSHSPLNRAMLFHNLNLTHSPSSIYRSSYPLEHLRLGLTSGSSHNFGSSHLVSHSIQKTTLNVPSLIPPSVQPAPHAPTPNNKPWTHKILGKMTLR